MVSIMIMSLAKLADVACNFCGDGEFSETAWACIAELLFSYLIKLYSTNTHEQDLNFSTMFQLDN